MYITYYILKVFLCKNKNNYVQYCTIFYIKPAAINYIKSKRQLSIIYLLF